MPFRHPACFILLTVLTVIVDTDDCSSEPRCVNVTDLRNHLQWCSAPPPTTKQPATLQCRRFYSKLELRLPPHSGSGGTLQLFRMLQSEKRKCYISNSGFQQNNKLDNMQQQDGIYVMKNLMSFDQFSRYNYYSLHTSYLRWSGWHLVKRPQRFTESWDIWAHLCCNSGNINRI